MLLVLVVINNTNDHTYMYHSCSHTSMVYNDGMAGIQTHMRQQRVESKEPAHMATYALVFDALFDACL